MPRYKLTIEYDGTPFNGWQRQHDVPSVQAVLEDACSSFVATSTEVFCAGRTDAGVHAKGQVVHVDFPEARDPYIILRGLNTLMRPHPVAVVKAEEVADDFNARTSAVMRHYEYHIINREARLTLDELRAWYVRKHLDIAAMQEGANRLLGAHDFTTFRDSDCQAKHANRTLSAFTVRREGPRIIINVSGKSFLHHMVRNMVGTLALVGHGKWSPEDVTKALLAKDRRAGGPTAPAHALYFMLVDY
jgi:tRNA pseudouridine38-40 synthase